MRSDEGRVWKLCSRASRLLLLLIMLLMSMLLLPGIGGVRLSLLLHVTRYQRLRGEWIDDASVLFMHWLKLVLVPTQT